MKSRYLLETGRLREAMAFVSDPTKRPANADRWVQVEITLLEAFANGSDAAKREAVTRLTGYARSDSPYVPLIAGALTMLREAPLALDMLEGYYFARRSWRAAHQDRPMTGVLFLTITAALRQHPRFSALLRETGLERYWAETKTIPDYRRYG